MEFRNPTQHSMTRRAAVHDYSTSGIYHITLHVADSLGQPLGRVVGDLDASEGSADAPRVALSPVGEMVEYELLHSITAHYPMIEVHDHIVMPEHIHCLVIVHDRIVSQHGKVQTLGQAIAGFKKGCNKRYWEMTGQGSDNCSDNCSGQTAAHSAANTPALESRATDAPPALQALATLAALPPFTPQPAPGYPSPSGSAAPAGNQPAPGNPSPAGGAALAGSVAAGLPGGIPGAPGAPCVPGVPALFPSRPAFKVPSSASSGRAPLFSPGYCDVMPVDAAQLATQRAYIKDNPRSRLLRSSDRARLHTQRGGIATALSPAALRGFLERECPPHLVAPDILAPLFSQLLMAPDGTITCDSFGDRRLLSRPLLPVVCHRKDAPRFAEQKARCLDKAAHGTVLVSARIAKGEQAIMDEAVRLGFPVALIHDNGFPDRYHPSADRLSLCAAGRLLLITPWQYHYRPKDEGITVAACKTMNCLAQALCRTKDTWWKQS